MKKAKLTGLAGILAGLGIAFALESCQNKEPAKQREEVKITWITDDLYNVREYGSALDVENKKIYFNDEKNIYQQGITESGEKQGERKKVFDLEKFTEQNSLVGAILSTTGEKEASSLYSGNGMVFFGIDYRTKNKAGEMIVGVDTSTRNYKKITEIPTEEFVHFVGLDKRGYIVGVYNSAEKRFAYKIVPVDKGEVDFSSLPYLSGKDISETEPIKKRGELTYFRKRYEDLLNGTILDVDNGFITGAKDGDIYTARVKNLEARLNEK